MISRYMHALLLALTWSVASALFSWRENTKILGEGSESGQKFGSSVAIDNNWMVVGAEADSENGDGSGAAFLYKQKDNDPRQWEFIRRLEHAAAESQENFGISVAIQGNIIAVGAHFRDTTEASLSGAVFIFKTDDDSFEQELNAPVPREGSGLGFSLSIDLPYVVAGAPFDDNLVSQGGAVFVFKQVSDGSFNETGTKLVPNGVSNDDFFGIDVGVSGNRLVGGLKGLNGNRGGAIVYVTEDDGETWELEQTLEARHSDEGDETGQSVDIEGSVVVLGSKSIREINLPFSNDNRQGIGGRIIGFIRGLFSGLTTRLREFLTENLGAVYVFNLRDGSWRQVDRLRPRFSPGAKLFGNSVALQDGRLIVGAPGGFRPRGTRESAGEVLIFAPRFARSRKWRMRSNVAPFDLQDLDNFGASVAYSNGTLVVGAPDEDTGGLTAGAVYTFYNRRREDEEELD